MNCNDSEWFARIWLRSCPNKKAYFSTSRRLNPRVAGGPASELGPRSRTSLLGAEEQVRLAAKAANEK